MKKKLRMLLFKAHRPLLCRRNPFPITPTLPISLKPQAPSSTYLWRFPSLSTPRPFSSTPTTPSQKRCASEMTVCTIVSDDIEPEYDIIEWEVEETEPRIGDGGDGGGVVLQSVPWGDQVLSVVHEVLRQFSDDVKSFAYMVSPRGYIYVRLDKLSNDYGCPSVEEVESYSLQYKKRLEEEGSRGEIPDDLALEVSSPDAERLQRVPDNLHEFQDFPMALSYVDDEEAKSKEKSGVFCIDSNEPETGNCVWKLADVKLNRDPSSKGRPLLKLPYTVHRKVTLHLEF